MYHGTLAMARYDPNDPEYYPQPLTEPWAFLRHFGNMYDVYIVGNTPDNVTGTAIAFFHYLLGSAVCQIILLNALIAIMADTFSRVKEQNERVFYKERATLLNEYFHFFSCAPFMSMARKIKHDEGTYLHMAVPISQIDEDGRMINETSGDDDSLGEIKAANEYSLFFLNSLHFNRRTFFECDPIHLDQLVIIFLNQFSKKATSS